MKKILATILIVLSFASSAFATAISTGTALTTAGLAVYGGVDATAAGAAPSPLVKFSTGVFGQVNFDATAHDAYAILTKHTSGSKLFGTANDSTNIYWKQVITGALVNGGTVVGNANFTSALGWTAY